jgi:hypothetical protein
MFRHLSLSAAALLVAFSSSLASAAIIFNGNLTDTSQIRSATNNPFFAAGQTDVAGVNFHFGSTVAGGSNVQGIAFDNVDPDPNNSPYVLLQNGGAATLTLGGIFAGRERTQALNATGPNDTVLETVANQKYFVQTGETVTLTVSGLTASRNALVQVIGGDSGGGWTGQFRVNANGSLVGDWTTVTDENPLTASLFAFTTTTSATGTLALDFNIFTGSYASIAGFVISEEVLIAPVPEPSSALLLAVGCVVLAARRQPRFHRLAAAHIR